MSLKEPVPPKTTAAGSISFLGKSGDVLVVHIQKSCWRTDKVTTIDPHILGFEFAKNNINLIYELVEQVTGPVLLIQNFSLFDFL